MSHGCHPRGQGSSPGLAGWLANSNFTLALSIQAHILTPENPPLQILNMPPAFLLGREGP